MKRKLVIFSLFVVLLALPVAAACARPAAPGKPATLNLVSGLAKNMVTMQAPLYFIDEVNRRAKGELTINYKGGPETIPTFDQPDALIKGVMDLNATVTNYYAGVLPTAYVTDLSRFRPSEQTQGTELYDYLVKMFEEKGVRYIGEYYGTPGTMGFFIFLNKEVKKPEELSGLKVRVSPLTRQWAEALGLQPITMPAGDIYLAMERGTVDGFIWPLYDSFNELAFGKIAKYAIDHRAYHGIMGMYANLNAWNALPRHLQKLLLEVQLEAEKWNIGFIAAQYTSQRDRATAAGVKFIKFSEADAARYVKTAEDALWAHFKKGVSPERYTKLRQLLKYE